MAIDRNNFSLPGLGKRLLAIRDDVLLAGRGFMVIRGVPVARYSMAEAAAADAIIETALEVVPRPL